MTTRRSAASQRRVSEQGEGRETLEARVVRLEQWKESVATREYVLLTMLKAGAASATVAVGVTYALLKFIENP